MLRERLTALMAVSLFLTGSQRAIAGEGVHRFDPPRLVSAVETLYPERIAASGTVILEVTVEKSGKLGTVQVVRGLPKLTEEAERSVRQWKFEPARLDGQRVAAPMLAAFTFSLALPCSGATRVRVGREGSSPYEPIRIISTAPTSNPSADIAFGTAALQVTVGAGGAAGKVEVIDGITPLVQEAERSVRHWRFRPAKFDGTPLAAPMAAVFMFSDLPPAQCSRF